MGIVAAASDEARQAGRAGRACRSRRRGALCPEAVFRRGDLDAYARVSEEVTAILLAASRRVERPSADEAYVDLTPGGARRPAAGPRGGDDQGRAPAPPRPRRLARPRLLAPRRARRLGVGASRAACSSSCPATSPPSSRGKPVSAPRTCRPTSRRRSSGPASTTLGQVADGRRGRARRRRRAPRPRAASGPPRAGRQEPPIAVAAPPASLQEEATIRDRRSDRARARGDRGRPRPAGCRRLQARSASPPRAIARRGAPRGRRRCGAATRFSPGLADEDAIAARRARAGRAAARAGRRACAALQVRLARLDPPRPQAPLFPDAARRAAAPRRGRLRAACAGAPPRQAAHEAPRHARARAPRASSTSSRRPTPRRECALCYRNAFELAVATILSAQCTDERVNKVTPRALRALSRRRPRSPAAPLADSRRSSAPPASSGRRRGASSASRRGLVERPRRRGAADAWPRWSRCPGIGRKTANVVLGHAFGIAEGIAVDTHVLRVTNRLGLADGRRPDRGRERSSWRSSRASAGRGRPTSLIFHGRKVCDARRPACGVCPLFASCALGEPAGLGRRPPPASGRSRRGRRPAPARPPRPATPAAASGG